MTAPHFVRAPAHLIAEAIGPQGEHLYLGGDEAARDLALLRELGIQAVVNCAVNLDINYVQAPYLLPEAERLAGGHGAIRSYKLGLVDGPGNPAAMLLAGYYLLQGAFCQQLPDKPSYPCRERGHVLLHCRAGRSRSVALAALYLHHQQPEHYPSLQAAIDHIRQRRELRPEEWFETPKPSLIQAIEQADRMLRVLADQGL
ncbi:dual specificity protein phosphatase [Pseudaeromonas paramecii]|uniref:Dual specificity protein phosphatase n=1 Tax=Pseudaeromonas paramecii TaxID=2138166 RepID=A0ABP8PZK1_9GAMM